MKQTYIDQKEWQLVGHFGVDAGLVWIGDPCYILHSEDGLPASLGKDWNGFCDMLDTASAGPTMKSFSYALGHEGLGICCSTGMGDGIYAVYARVTDEGMGKRVSQLFIDFNGDFFGEDEDEDDETYNDHDDEEEEQDLCEKCGRPLDAGNDEFTLCPDCDLVKEKFMQQ